MTQNERHDQLTRRRVLAAGASLAAAIAGCLGDDDSDDSADESEMNETNDTEDQDIGDDTGNSDESDDDDTKDDEVGDDDEASGDDETADSDTDDANGGDSLDLLAEAGIDHEHACLHAEFDERNPLEAGSAEDSPTTVEETHVMWEVAVEGESGYISFDVGAHEHDGPFVFYTAGGAATPVVGSEDERDAVPEDACTDLEEYVQVSPEDGQLTIEVTAA